MLSLGYKISSLCGGLYKGKLGLHRGFHTTSATQYNAIIEITLKQVAKLASIITGRQTRKWWQKLPQAEKKRKLRALRRHRIKLLLASGGIATYGGYNYYSHLEDAPVTSRRRYIAFTHEQFRKIAKYEFDKLWEDMRGTIVSPDHPAYKRIIKVATSIIDANQDLEYFREQHWMVVVVDSSHVDAFVLPNGVIFVNTGLLEMAHNDHQLAYILGHEMAHTLLSHAAEKISWAGIIDTCLIFVLAALWALVPNDGIAFVTQYFMNEVMRISLTLPYSRKLETEADQVGLHLIAKACYDIRESSAFWQKIQMIDRSQKQCDWLSTHPSHSARVQLLNDAMPQASEVRKSCECCALPKTDPRTEMLNLAQDMEEYIKNLETDSKDDKLETPVKSQLFLNSFNKIYANMNKKYDKTKIKTAVQNCFILPTPD